MQTTPSIMRFHLDNLNNMSSFSSLKYITLAGEPLPKALVSDLKKNYQDAQYTMVMVLLKQPFSLHIQM